MNYNELYGLDNKKSFVNEKTEKVKQTKSKYKELTEKKVINEDHKNDLTKMIDEVEGQSEDYYTNFNTKLKDFPTLIKLAGDLGSKLKPTIKDLQKVKTTINKFNASKYRNLIYYVNELADGIYDLEFSDIEGRNSAIQLFFEELDSAVTYYDTGIDMESMDIDDKIKRAFMSDKDEEVTENGDTGYGYGTSYESGNREYAVFEDYDKAKSEAVEQVKQDLEDSPENFTQSWLTKFITMSDTDRRLTAQDLSDLYADGLNNEDYLDGGGVLSEWEDLEEKLNDLDYDDKEYDKIQKEMDDLVETGKEKMIENSYEEIYDELEDPIQYFVHDTGMYSMEDLLHSNFIQIDYEKASQDVVDTDGVAHFLAGYDGNEMEITDPVSGDSYFVYRWN